MSSNGGTSAIMASLDPLLSSNGANTQGQPLISTSNSSQHFNGLPDVLSTELQSLNLHADVSGNRLSFLLIDAKDRLTVGSEDDFALMLGCQSGADEQGGAVRAKVVSMVGNTGEGKSYALNKALFLQGPDQEEVFSTSPSAENSCTRGVWAAFEPKNRIVVLDTEGMLGGAANSSLSPQSTAPDNDEMEVNENLRMRQLLKVLAVSDVVVYKTRAERLHSDLFYFLGDASKAYNEHFSAELQRVADKRSGETGERKGQGGSCMMGPTVVIFHETQFTDVLAPRDAHGRTPEIVLRDRLASLNQDVSAFSKICYIGVKRGAIVSNGDDDPGGSVEEKMFGRLGRLIEREVEDTQVRSPRSLALIFKTLQSLGEKFSGEITRRTSHLSFPDEYFTCQSKCLACQTRCSKAINHDGDHTANVGATCIYQKSLDNKHLYCLRCYQNGRRIVVVPKASSSEESGWFGLATYAWSGYVLECKVCGVIYRSRQHWYGNEDAESLQVVQSEVSHIWPGVRTLQGTHNAARRVLDGVQVLSNTVSSLSGSTGSTAVVGQTTKTLSGWMADQIAPDYWRPNNEITNCNLCGINFFGPKPENVGCKIHHCRACGEGFCSDCSNYKRPVPERGWEEPVRVCRGCMNGGGGGGGLNTSLDSTSTLQSSTGPASGSAAEAVQARLYGEKVVGTIGSLASAMLEYPIGALKDSARPAYWVPDEDIEHCCVCQANFKPPKEQNWSISQLSGGVMAFKEPQAPPKVHHCRSCGKGVCNVCSKTRRPVPTRGWDTPVRICDDCANIPCH